MADNMNVFIYGDSIMKATSTDDSLHLKFNIKSFLDRLCNELAVNVINRAHFGATVIKGFSFLRKDLDRGLPENATVLLEFGGNDCDYDWKEVSARPEDSHQPNVPLPKFVETLTTMVGLIRNAGATPVFMTIPPISSEKYFTHITRNGLSADNILNWLGDKEEIYRHHEHYSSAVANLARQLNVVLIDVRQYFLSRHDFNSLISIDGIHPTLKGYEIIYNALKSHLKEAMA